MTDRPDLVSRDRFGRSYSIGGQEVRRSPATAFVARQYRLIMLSACVPRRLRFGECFPAMRHITRFRYPIRLTFFLRKTTPYGGRDDVVLGIHFMFADTIFQHRNLNLYITLKNYTKLLQIHLVYPGKTIVLFPCTNT